MEDLPKFSSQVMAKLELQSKFSFERLMPLWLHPELLVSFLGLFPPLSPAFLLPSDPFPSPVSLEEGSRNPCTTVYFFFFLILVLFPGIDNLKRHRALTEPCDAQL